MREISQEISIKVPTAYNQTHINNAIKAELGLKDNFTYIILRKSLDARKRSDIHWLLLVKVVSPKSNDKVNNKEIGLDISYKRRNKKVLVVGSGPAGFFAAYLLQLAGFQTILIERGKDVDSRASAISSFEKGASFDSKANYAFGEGGAGTFSDGKLTSRSKHIVNERKFILAKYVEAGAPQEIEYMSHPHLGSDNLKKIVKNLRNQFTEIGGKILFETFLDDFQLKGKKVVEAITNMSEINADYFIVASGHSAYETYKMLMRKGVKFQNKNFAIGARVEHHQSTINLAQWGKESLPGLKAAEYRLTRNKVGSFGVYTFCMCPGGTVVPASGYSKRNILNGMSNYNRDLKFASSACVAGVNLNGLAHKRLTPLESLEWLDALEKKFYDFSNGYKAPFCSIKNFIKKKEQSEIVETSYPLGLEPAPLWELLPNKVSESIRGALREFNHKLRGFDEGIIMGLESKTSAPIQVLREKSGLCEGFDNLYMVGEGSGWAGGIISSAADGIKAAMDIIES